VSFFAVALALDWFASWAPQFRLRLHKAAEHAAVTDLETRAEELGKLFGEELCVRSARHISPPRLVP
jgi:hypothetical protein